jgi:hypothetical protein
VNLNVRSFRSSSSRGSSIAGPRVIASRVRTVVTFESFTTLGSGCYERAFKSLSLVINTIVLLCWPGLGQGVEEPQAYASLWQPTQKKPSRISRLLLRLLLIPAPTPTSTPTLLLPLRLILPLLLRPLLARRAIDVYRGGGSLYRQRFVGKCCFHLLQYVFGDHICYCPLRCCEKFFQCKTAGVWV